MTGVKDLPELIKEPGDYVTRDGRRVTISAIVPEYYFSAKGCLWKMYRGKVRPRGYNAWHKSGRLYPLSECDGDIVGQWLGEV